MSLIHARHPYPIRVRPKRGKPHQTNGVAVTPVEIPEASASDFDRVTFLPMPGPVYLAHEGGLWLRPRLGEGFATFADLKALMEEDGYRARPEVDHLYASLVRTPFRPRENENSDRGYPYEPPAGVEVLIDGRERGAAALRDFVAREVRLVGDAVYLKAAGPLASFDHHGASALAFPRLQWRDDSDRPAVRLDRAGELAAYVGWADKWPDGIPGHADLEDLDAIPASLLRDDDLELMANRLPQLALRQALYHAPKPKDPARRGRLVAVAEGLVATATAGNFGLVRGDEVGPVLEGVAGAFAELVAVREESRAEGERWAKAVTAPPGPRRRAVFELVGRPPDVDAVLAQVRELALPRLSAGPAPEDEEALSGLRPGF